MGQKHSCGPDEVYPKQYDFNKDLVVVPMDVNKDSKEESPCKRSIYQEIPKDEYAAFSPEVLAKIGSHDDKIILPSGEQVLKTTIENFLRRNVHTHIYKGEVSFYHPKKIRGGDIDLTDVIHPLTFMRLLGTYKSEGIKLLRDDVTYTKFHIVIQEARVLTRRTTHNQATLLYAAAEFTTPSYHMAEYLRLLTFAIITGKIKNFPQLRALIEVIRMVTNGIIEWRDVLSTRFEDETKIAEAIMRNYTVGRIFSYTLRMAWYLRQEDNRLQGILESYVQAEESLLVEHGKLPDEIGDWGKKKVRVVLKVLQSRVLLSKKEMAKQSNIFANYYTHKVYKNIPLIAHMIARGHFKNHFQIAAAVDYLIPICGSKVVKMMKICEIIEDVKDWVPSGF